MEWLNNLHCPCPSFLTFIWLGIVDLGLKIEGLFFVVRIGLNSSFVLFDWSVNKKDNIG